MTVLFRAVSNLVHFVSFYCIGSYGVEPREGKPTYQSDSEVICTSFYSKLNPLEDGEVLYSHFMNPDKDQ